jgi:signal transduction histidine kinase
VNNSDLVSRLAAHRTLGAAPRHELEWMAAHGRLRRVSAGDVLAPKGESIDTLHVVLSGRYSIWANRGTGPRKVMEWRGGDVTGLLPYSRMSRAPGDVIAEEPTEILDLHRDYFPALIRECQEVTAILVHVMLDRARHFTSTGLQAEKMVSLGNLAAGLAHELNNPASAVVRSAKGMAECLVEAEKTSLELGAARLPPAQLAAIDQLRHLCVDAVARSARPALEQADREETIAAWLDEHGVALAAAQALADSAVTLAALDRAAALLDRPTLDLGLRWVAANCTAQMLVADIEVAATRIHGLVAAVKGFTHMDQASVPGLIDIRQGLADTVTVLRAKARSKGVSVDLAVEPDLPAVEGFAGELNQVWLNLIDNALDAVAERGRVEVTAGRVRSSLVVRVIDNGPGIPPEILDRIFDPFFTTKPVGHGTGLGLDIAQRLVRRHEGEIDVESRPGRTEFRVTLPSGRPAEGERRETALARETPTTGREAHAETGHPDR